MTLPLQGIRVLELGDFLPSAFCCMQLADFGAEVIRIQAPAKAAGGRRAEQAAQVPSETRSPFQAEACFDTVGRNRRSVVVDLKDPAGQAVGRKLAASCDVLVEGFRPGVMDRLGLGYEALKELAPRLVYCSITLFGQTGPYRDWPGHDPLGLGVAGVLYLNSDPSNDVPRLVGSPVGDISAALHGTIGVMMALRARDHTGRGQLVDIGMTDASIDFSMFQAMQALQGTTVPRLNKPNPVSGIWETSDGKYICTTNLEPHHWANFCISIGRNDLIPLRYDRARRDELFTQVRGLMRTRTQAQWLEAFHGELESQAAPVNDLQAMLKDPHVAARDMVIDTSDGAGNHGRQLGFSVKLQETPARLRNVAPPVGADSRAVLRELGYGSDQIESLLAAGVVQEQLA